MQDLRELVVELAADIGEKISHAFQNALHVRIGGWPLEQARQRGVRLGELAGELFRRARISFL